MKRIFNVLVGIITCSFIFFFCFDNVNTLASDLLQNTEDFKEDIEEEYQSIQDIDQEIEDYGSISSLEEVEEVSDPVLHDYTVELKAINPGGNVRTIITNTYDPTNTWLFDQQFFLIQVTGTNLSPTTFYIFPDGYFGNDQDTLITDFYNYLISDGSTWYKKHFRDETNGFYFDYVSDKVKATSSTDNNATMNRLTNMLKNSGYPSKNTYWEVPEVTPDPTPDPTPSVSPTPDPEQNQGVIYMENKPDMIVMIFGIGCLLGFVSGYIFLGFIK